MNQNKLYDLFGELDACVFIQKVTRDLSEEERAEYTTRSKAKPKSYVFEGGVESVTATLIDGGEIVDGCECGLMARYERFVSTERKAILAYFRAVAEKAEKQSYELKTGMSGIAA